MRQNMLACHKTHYLSVKSDYYDVQGVVRVHQNNQCTSLCFVGDASEQGNLSEVASLIPVLSCLLFRREVHSLRVINADEPSRRCAISESE